MAAYASDLDVANGILPGYIMGLYFFTGYALRLQVRTCHAASLQLPRSSACSFCLTCASSTLHAIQCSALHLSSYMDWSVCVTYSFSKCACCICSEPPEPCKGSVTIVVIHRICRNGLAGSTTWTSCTMPGPASCSTSSSRALPSSWATSRCAL